MTVASFREIPKIVADNWRAIDPITKMFMEAVASILKERYAQFPDCVKTLRKTIKKNKRSLSPVDSSSKEPSLTRFCQEVGTLDSWSFDFSRQMPYQDKAARRFSEVPISDREIIGYWVSAD